MSSRARGDCLPRRPRSGLGRQQYYWPPHFASQHAERHGIVEPSGGLKIPTGVAYPVVILIGVALLMTYVAAGDGSGRYVYAIGGHSRGR